MTAKSTTGTGKQHGQNLREDGLTVSGTAPATGLS
jgi:hypothetical protein